CADRESRMNAQPTQHDPVAMKHSLRGRPRELLIGGQWRAAVDGKTLDVLDPATGDVFAQAAAGAAADIDLAVKAARKAFEEGPWRSTPPNERARCGSCRMRSRRMPGSWRCWRRSITACLCGSRRCGTYRRPSIACATTPAGRCV